MSAAVTADRGFTWSDDETALLLRLWGGNDAQSELTGNKRNFVVYEKISETMNNMGFLRSASQCREKIKRMKREYTLTKQHNEQTTGPKKHMRFYEQFEKILFEKQSRNQKNASSKFCLNNSGNEFEADEMEFPRKTTVRNERKLRKIAPKNVQPKKLHENVEKEDPGNPWSPDVVLVEEDAPTALFENQNIASTSSANDAPLLINSDHINTQRCRCEFQIKLIKIHFQKSQLCSGIYLIIGDLKGKKRRKLSSQMSLFKCMMDSLTLKFTKYQADFDKKVLNRMEELENERIAMDERIKKMWTKFEEKRRVDEEEHELNIMNAFQDIMNQLKSNHAETT
ncbi:hypothetical protein TNIN_469932 [Trichonephila inaurata madagascariensis]|uniref:Myb/SANT-like DNA-binding domain-containing protein n=1 Tax=Trichonephila inaurata madagascariensis TaxID=2747483 RepID=A0A8X6Y7N8_9ARAC|nr:hypothetical protein TNIN_469932 [Trichonephila inaurata madagascariensis]